MRKVRANLLIFIKRPIKAITSLSYEQPRQKQEMAKAKAKPTRTLDDVNNTKPRSFTSCLVSVSG